MASIVIGGVLVGILYALLGLGVALAYRVSSVLNFAVGVTATCGSYCAWWLLSSGVPAWVATLGAIACGGVIALALQVLLVDRMPSHAYEAISIATLGATVLIQGILLGLFGSESRALSWNPGSGIRFGALGMTVTGQDLVSLGVLVLVSLGLAVVLYRTRFGLNLRAISEGPVTSGLVGINVRTVKALTWTLSGAIAGVAGLIITPAYYLSPDFLTTFMIGAFVGIVLGGLESLSGVLVGAVIYGVGAAFFSYYVAGNFSETVALLVLVVVLSLFPQGLFGRRLLHVPELQVRVSRLQRRLFNRRSSESGEPRGMRPPQGTAPAGRWLRAPGLVIVLIAFLVPLVTQGSLLFLLATTAGTYLAVLGTDIIYGYTGQTTIGQSAFMLIGAYSLYLLQERFGLSFPVAVLCAFAIAGVVGAIVAIPTVRLSGVYLAVVTLSLALAVPELLQDFGSVTGGSTGVTVAAPGAFGATYTSNVGIYLYTLVVAVVFTGITVTFGAMGWRIRMGAVRDSARAAAAAGMSPYLIRLTGFAVGSALAGVAGAILAAQVGYLTPQSYTVWNSIYLLAAVVVGGAASVPGALLGSVFITIVPYFSGNVASIPDLVVGGALCLSLILVPGGLVSLGRGAHGALGSRRLRRQSMGG